MSFLKRLFGAEKRSSPESGSVGLSDAAAWHAFFGQQGLPSAASGITVSAETALGMAAFWCGLNFMADAMASLPLQVFKTQGENSRKALSGSDIYRLVHAVANPDLTSFDWRRGKVLQFYTRGAGYTYIERNATGAAVALWPLDANRVYREIIRSGARVYHYQRLDGSTVTYPAADIIDFVWMRCPDWVNHIDPIAKFRESFANAIAAERHQGRHFANGGVLPYILEGPFGDAGSAARAKADVDKAIRDQAANGTTPVLALPLNHTLKSIGAAPQQSQLVELQRFAIGQAARFFGIPPAAMQEYSDSKFTVAEQQDLSTVKHSLRPRLVQLEQQLNLRLFGPRPGGRYVEHNVDALLRGDFKTRSEGLARLVTAGVMMPNEARAYENLEAAPLGDCLYIQGAMVPLDMAGKAPAPADAAPTASASAQDTPTP